MEQAVTQRTPTSSPWAVWNPCKINKALNKITQLAVKILFDDSTGFDEMRWTIILPEKQK